MIRSPEAFGTLDLVSLESPAEASHPGSRTTRIDEGQTRFEPPWSWRHIDFDRVREDARVRIDPSLQFGDFGFLLSRGARGLCREGRDQQRDYTRCDPQ